MFLGKNITNKPEKQTSRTPKDIGMNYLHSDEHQLWKEFWHMKFEVKFLWLYFSSRNKANRISSWNKLFCFHVKGARVKGKKLKMPLTEDCIFIYIYGKEDIG